jgi:hypothetical protein
MKWKGRKNGDLLRAAEREFDVFVTVDQSLARQQNFSGLKLAVIVLAARTNEIDALRPLMPRLRQIVRRAKPGRIVRLAV